MDIDELAVTMPVWKEFFEGGEVWKNAGRSQPGIPRGIFAELELSLGAVDTSASADWPPCKGGRRGSPARKGVCCSPSRRRVGGVGTSPPLRHRNHPARHGRTRAAGRSPRRPRPLGVPARGHWKAAGVTDGPKPPRAGARPGGDPRRAGLKPAGKDSGGGGPGVRAEGGWGPAEVGPGEDFSRKRRKQREAATAAGGGQGRRARINAGRARREGRERAERYASLQDAYRSKVTNASASSKRTVLKQREAIRGPVAGRAQVRRRRHRPQRRAACLRTFSEYSSTAPPPGRRSRDLKYAGDGFRLVRCMRRWTAHGLTAVSAGRVRVNGALVKPSFRVRSGNVVTLDGKALDWEPFAAATEVPSGARFPSSTTNPGGACTMEAS